MKVTRRMEMRVKQYEIGDQIKIDGGRYTATCQETDCEGKGIFCFDHYLEKYMPMRKENAVISSYLDSDLRTRLNGEVLSIFSELLGYMLPFSNGDYVRLPYIEEVFGDNVHKHPLLKHKYWEPESFDGIKQWPLMSNWRNRISCCKTGFLEWGWLLNRMIVATEEHASWFSCIDHRGDGSLAFSDNEMGVRPVFLLRSPDENSGEDYMLVLREVTVSATENKVGDQVEIGEGYRATCQVTDGDGIGTFCFDHYLDEAMPMNGIDNLGGYLASDLRKRVNSEEVLSILSAIRDDMVPFSNGDLVRVPYAEELFGDYVYQGGFYGDKRWDCERFNEIKQWPLMTDSRNRVAGRKDDEKHNDGWTQNEAFYLDEGERGIFVCVDGQRGDKKINWKKPSLPVGVRLVFQLRTKRDDNP